MSLSSNTGRHRVRRPPTHPGLGGTWGPNPYTLYGSHGRTYTPPVPGMQDLVWVVPVLSAPHTTAPQVSPAPLQEPEVSDPVPPLYAKPDELEAG